MWRRRVSIPVPLACKASALPFELHPRVKQMILASSFNESSLYSYSSLQIILWNKLRTGSDLYRGGNFSLVPPIGAWNFLKHDFEKEIFNFCNLFSWVSSSGFFFSPFFLGDKKLGNFWILKNLMSIQLILLFFWEKT